MPVRLRSALYPIPPGGMGRRASARGCTPRACPGPCRAVTGRVTSCNGSGDATPEAAMPSAPPLLAPVPDAQVVAGLADEARGRRRSTHTWATVVDAGV